MHSSHTLVKYCSKFSKPGFSNTWTVNFQMFKLVLKKAEESEIKLPISSGSLKMWELDCEESWALKNWCFWTVMLETLESPLDCKEIQPVHSEGDQSWAFIGRTDAKAETPILWTPHAKCWPHWKRPWCWERLRAGGEGDDRGWDGWMASQTRWTWVWVDSGSWWWTGRPGVLWFMGSQRVGHNWDWTEYVLERKEEAFVKYMQRTCLTLCPGNCRWSLSLETGIMGIRGVWASLLC